MKKNLPALVLALALCLTPAAAERNGPSQSGRVIEEALSLMGYTEGAREATKFGRRYGYPHGYWCDMFVSWCAEEAGVPAEIFPTHVTCSVHCRLFQELDCFQPGAARGGSYQPRQGDVVFFYSQATGRIHHIGFVLYVENGELFTIEGNALTNRRDHSAGEVSALRRGDREPRDYVTVNSYALEDARLYGYAVPAYESREPLDLEGFVDLGPWSGFQTQLEELSAAGIMLGTSSHTFSPRNGLSRGAFVQAVAALCGLRDQGAAKPFADVPADSPYFSAVMAARSAGLIQGDEVNRFAPEIYISGEDAQAILSKALILMGRKDRAFSFGEGDMAYMLEPYTTRIDIAKALYAIWAEEPREEERLETEPFDGTVVHRGKELDLAVRCAGGARYVSLPTLTAVFPELRVLRPLGAFEAGPGGAGGEAVWREVALDMEGRTVTLKGFLYDGVLYAPLEPVAELLSVELQAKPAE